MVNLMYEIGKVDGEEIREEENRQQQKSAYDDREDKNILIDNFGRIAKKRRVSVTYRMQYAVHVLHAKRKRQMV